MGSRKTREEVVECYLAHQIHDCKLPANGITVSLPNAVRAQRQVQKTARPNSQRVGIRIVGSVRDDVNERSGAMWGTARLDRLCDRRKDVAAIKSNRVLLIACQSESGGLIRDAHHDQAAVEPPGQTEPQSS